MFSQVLMAIYRQNVAALILNEAGDLLVGERIKHPGAYQFPQGGVDQGEKPLQALYREIEEEIGIPRKAIEVLGHREGYRYRFPKAHRRWGIYDGQEQTYYLCRFLGPEQLIRLDLSKPEFRSYLWIRPEEFQLFWLPDFKRPVYREVLKDFFGVEMV
jgi:putative (di)nucleoside polyphosphate hydrolase